VVLAGALVAVASAPAFAERLTLEACIGLALKNNPVVIESEARLKRADADVLGAWSGFLPSARVSGTWSHPEEPVFVPDRAAFFGETWSANLSAGLTLFDGLGNVSGYRQASHGRKSARASHRKAMQDVMLETQRRFFEVGKRKALVDVQREAVRLSAEQLKKTRTMKDLGAATQADVYKAEVDHSNNRLAELRADRDLAIGKAILAASLGLDPLEEIELADEDLAITEAMGLDDASRRALEVNPALLSSEAGLDAGRSGVSFAKSGRYPSLDLFYASNYYNVELKDFDDEHIQWSYGAQVNLTIFDGLLTKSRIRRAEADLLAARRTVESTRRDVLLAVRQAYLDLEIARQSIEVAEEAVRSSEEDLRLAQERYKIGEGTILDVIDAQVNLTRSKTDRITTIYDARLAQSALRNAIGDTPVPEPAP
jgi:outer membrane protein TolC